MPTIDSAKKRMRQSEKRRKRNQKRKSRMRTAVKKYEEALEDEDLEAARSLIGNAESELDRAATKGVIPKSRASRKVSRLKKALSKLEQQEG